MAEEALDGTVVEETEASPGQGHDPSQAPPATTEEEPETLESLKAKLDLVNQKHEQRAAQANAHLREMRQYKQELAQLKAERQAEKEARYRQEAQRLQAARAEVYVDAPDYVVDLAAQLDGLKLQLQGDPEEEARIDQEEEVAVQVAETLQEAQSVFERDPITWDAFAFLIAAEKNVVREQALLTGNYMTEDEINDYIGRQSAHIMAEWRRNGVQIDTGIKYLAWNRNWRPPEQQTGKQQAPQPPGNGQQSASQARLNNQRQTQARRAPLSGPASVGATGRPAADYSALSEEEWYEARMSGAITDAQAEAYEQSLLAS